MRKKVLLTPKQKETIDRKIREHKALKEIRETLKNYRSKKQ